MFKVTPALPKRKKAVNIERGIAVPTKSAFLKPKKKSNTAITKIIPNMMEFSNSETVFLVWSD